jgi:very-short-patch-repair endonuclease
MCCLPCFKEKLVLEVDGMYTKARTRKTATDTVTITLFRWRREENKCDPTV